MSLPKDRPAKAIKGARVGTGGARPHLGKGGTRGKGQYNDPDLHVGRKRDKKIEAQVELAEYTGLTPLEFMLNTMRNPKLDITTRLQAARDAAPYVHAKLQSITVKGDPNAPMATTELTPAQYRDIVTKALSSI